MIDYENGNFVCPANVPFAKELSEKGWRRAGEIMYTNDPQRVVPFIEHLSDALASIMEVGAKQYREASALVPSKDFTAPVPEGLTLFPFQLAAVERILKLDSTLLAEDAGLGKSAIMTVVANAMHAKRVLIICPAIAKYNWFLKEWPKWTTLSHLTVDVAEGDYFPDTDVVIINYDILERHKKKLNAHRWDLLIIDESHRIRNEEAKRTVMVLGGSYKAKKGEATESGAEQVKRGRYKVTEIPYRKRIFASATPMDKPCNLWTMAVACDPKGLGSDWKHFHQRYCAAFYDQFGWNVDGADNLDELGALLRSRFMIRHNPDDVLNLPPLTEPVVVLPPIDIVSSEEEQFVRDNISTLLDLAKEIGQPLTAEATTEDFLQVIGTALVDNLKAIGSPKFEILFTQFAIIRKNTGIAKVDYVAKFVNEVSQDGSLPVVIFAYHRDVINRLREIYPNAAYIMGGMSSKERNRQVDLFQNGETNIFIGNIDAAGEAVTLTRSNTLVFAEMDWRATAMIQARKRIHRISQENPCTAYYLCAAKSFDYYVSKKAFRKMEHIKTTLDI
jgi:SNF2 family DNA or RNA helicase